MLPRKKSKRISFAQEDLKILLMKRNRLLVVFIALIYVLFSMSGIYSFIQFAVMIITSKNQLDWAETGKDLFFFTLFFTTFMFAEYFLKQKFSTLINKDFHSEIVRTTVNHAKLIRPEIC